MESAVDLDPEFTFVPRPAIGDDHEFALRRAANPLGPLAALIGKWQGKGFNTIWRPNSVPNQDRFLELELTTETLEFTDIGGEIPNRGLLQPDIKMFGVHYLQKIDHVKGGGLHLEPGIWATVPRTTHPREDATVVRMASIPHGTTIVAQGATLPAIAGPPPIRPNNITPFQIGSPTRLIHFPESNLAAPTPFRSTPADMAGVTQAMVDNPNSVLTAAMAGQTITHTETLRVSTASAVIGGGTSNTAFLVGDAQGPNAKAANVESIFWIETVKGPPGQPDFLQLQYTQTVLLDFAGLSWPHVTVATLRKQ